MKLSLCTFNVHFFTSRNNINTFNEIFNDIQQINADIVVLEEAIFSSTFKKNCFFEKSHQIGYKYIKMCCDIGVNIVLSKKQIDNVKIMKIGKDKGGDRYAIYCYLNYHGKELEIIGCHLDVFDDTENTRLEQMKLIMANSKKENTIILGDFNSLRQNDYSSLEWQDMVRIDKERNVESQTKLINYIESLGFIDSFVLGNEPTPKNTVWSKRRVDYIYIKSNLIKNIKSNVYETYSSDHFPVSCAIELKIDD